MAINQNVNSIVKKLLLRNVKPIKVEPEGELVDAAIWITESIHIQVGYDYTMVCRDRPDGLAMYPCTLAIDDIMAKLKQAIDEGK